jgi:hypothetical protein
MKAATGRSPHIWRMQTLSVWYEQYILSGFWDREKKMADPFAEDRLKTAAT